MNDFNKSYGEYRSWLQGLSKQLRAIKQFMSFNLTNKKKYPT